MTRSCSDTRPIERLADTRRRVRSTTWLATAAATVVAGLFGVLFAQPDPTPAAAETPLPAFPAAQPSAAPDPDPVAAPPTRTSTTQHRTHRTPKPASPSLRPPTRQLAPATGSGRATSGAS